MSISVESAPVAKKPERKTLAVKLDAPIVKKAQTVADDRGIAVSEYLSDLVRAYVERDWSKIVRRIGTVED